MKNKGFTLIELMIVIAIIGILAAIIVPVIFGSNHTDANVVDTNRLVSTHGSQDTRQGVICYDKARGIQSGVVFETKDGKINDSSSMTVGGQEVEIPEEWFCLDR